MSPHARLPCLAALLNTFALALGGCDALLVDPAPPGMSVEIELDRARAGVWEGARADESSWGARELGIRFTHEGWSRDTTVVGKFEGGRFRATVWLRPEELVEGLEIRAEIRLPDGLTLFDGSGILKQLVLAPTVSIELRSLPVLAYATPGSDEVVISSPDGHHRTRLDFSEAFAVQVTPRVPFDVSHRDGTIVFRGRPQERGPYLALILDPYTGEQRRLLDFTNDSLPVHPSWPRFSHDGSWIYFSGIESGGSGPMAPGWELWRVRPDGTGAERLMGHPSITFPAPSPDGSRVVMGLDGHGSLGVYDVEADELTLLERDSHYVGWSPDGQWIAYVNRASQLWLMRPDGSEDRAVAPTLTVLPYFDWTEDGRIVAASTEGQALQIDVSTGAVEILTGLGPVIGISAMP